jgi:hypothetical protein
VRGAFRERSTPAGAARCRPAEAEWTLRGRERAARPSAFGSRGGFGVRARAPKLELVARCRWRTALCRIVRRTRGPPRFATGNGSTRRRSPATNWKPGGGPRRLWPRGPRRKPPPAPTQKQAAPSSATTSPTRHRVSICRGPSHPVEPALGRETARRTRLGSSAGRVRQGLPSGRPRSIAVPSIAKDAWHASLSDVRSVASCRRGPTGTPTAFLSKSSQAA